jgi:hypothetical protein
MSKKKMGAFRFPFVLISSSPVAAAAAIAPVATASVTATSAAPATVATTTVATSAATVSASSISAASAAPATVATTTVATTATVSASPISAATAAVATITAAATATRFVGLFNGHFLAADGRIVQCFNRSPGFGLIGHIYKAEAFTLPRLPIHHHLCKIHRAIQFEHFFQVGIVKIAGKTCYKKLHADRFKR